MSASERISCRELVEIVTDYLEGGLPPERRVAFEEHLMICPGCERYLAQMRETIRVSGSLTEESISADARDVLLFAFRDWSSE